MGSIATLTGSQTCTLGSQGKHLASLYDAFETASVCLRARYSGTMIAFSLLKSLRRKAEMR